MAPSNSPGGTEVSQWNRERLTLAARSRSPRWRHGTALVAESGLSETRRPPVGLANVRPSYAVLRTHAREDPPSATSHLRDSPALNHRCPMPECAVRRAMAAALCLLSRPPTQAKSGEWARVAGWRQACCGQTEARPYAPSPPLPFEASVHTELPEYMVYTIL
ncbi:Protein of unknown function [Gryllus bimaculatus]|nr:Protein of unknown function [Gryllus bimaculatus]